MADEVKNWVVSDLEKHAVPTGHLPKVPQDNGSQGSVPTGHLPKDPPPPKKD